ncbi:MAG TPA: chloride channel protein [Stellaceae bacterium]|nr:chloride channel protein [Stellaceae bacterium]
MVSATADHSSALPAEEDSRRLNLVVLSVLAWGLGIATGLGAVLFRDLIGFIHNLMFLGLPALRYDANLFTPPSPWGALVILVPVIGAVVVTFLVNNFAPEARGHGVPEVMDAIYYNSGRIRPVVAIVKSLASAVAIGTGAAVGREGPIIQIGSAMGSTLGQLIAMTAGQRITLVAAGAGAGIAATFNTPIGGVLFAIELMMPEVSVATFLPTAIATGTATFIGRLFFGSQPAFTVPPIAPLAVDATTALMLALYAVLGIIVGVAATGFIRGLHLFEDLFERIEQRYVRHILGMLLVGVLMYALFHNFGHYYVEGVGYATIQAILLNQTTVAWLLLLLFVCKLLATSLSLGSGSSGGIFSPSLFMGATLGAGFAGLLALLPLPMPIDPRNFALVGMGAMVGGGTGAVMTAVAMIFEMTRDYDIVTPMIIAVAFAVGVRRMLSRENIYTLKLYRRGHVVPKALHANMFLVRRAREVMDTDFALAPAEMSFDAFLRVSENQGRMRYLLVTAGDRIIGVQRVNTSLHHALEGADTGVTLGDVANSNFVIARDDDIVFDIIRRMWRHGAFMAIVVGGSGAAHPDDVKGVISKEHVADSVAASIRIYPG